jgi:hypothetical protein
MVVTHLFFFICIRPCDDKERIELRFLCRLFRDELKPPPLYTTFPHPNYSTLYELMERLNHVYQDDPTKAPKIVFVMEGTFQGNVACWVNMNYGIH